MIAAWMLYALAVSVLLWAAARATETVLSGFRLPTRWAWAASMIAMLVVPSIGFVGRAATQNRRVPLPSTRLGVETLERVVITTPEATNPTIAPRASIGLHIDNSLNTLRATLANPLSVFRAVDTRLLERWNSALTVCWIGGSLAAFGWLLGTWVRLRVLERSLSEQLVDGERVLVSNDVGPAVFGLLEPRIVIPAWLLDLPAESRATILGHERAHADADDPALVCVAFMLVALQPWNVALWFALQRLRSAIEADCDQRVVGVDRASVVAYAQLIVAVYMRSATQAAAHTAFAARPSNIARRFAKLTQRRRRGSLAVVGSFATATLCAAAAWLLAAPNLAATPIGLGTRARSVRRVFVPLKKDSLQTSGAVRKGIASTVETSVAPIRATAVHAPAILALVAAPRAAEQLEPCRSAPYPTGLAADNCEITGRIIVFAIDSSHVLIAYRDDNDTSAVAPYAIYGGPAGSVPNIRWRATGNARIRDHVLSIDNGMGQPMIAIGSDASVLRANYAKTGAALAVSMKAYLRDPEIDWESLWELAASDRCEKTYPLSPPTEAQFRDTSRVSTTPTSACVVRHGRSLRVIKY